MRSLDPKIAGIAATALLLGIGASTGTTQAQPVAPPESTEESGEECPDPLRGSTVSASPVKQGVAIDFETATKAQVPGLREHLQHLASVLAQHSEAHAAGDPHAAVMPEIEVTVDSIADGARLTMRTEKAADVLELRELGRDLEEVWAASPCAPGKSMPTSGIRAAH